jgi:hypothetical protein
VNIPRFQESAQETVHRHHQITYSREQRSDRLIMFCQKHFADKFPSRAIASAGSTNFSKRLSKASLIVISLWIQNTEADQNLR